MIMNMEAHRQNSAAKTLSETNRMRMARVSLESHQLSFLLLMRNAKSWSLLPD